MVDVLPTREAGPRAAWLIRHPGVEIIFRDRAGAYADGARRGAPDALQVADRFHLWQGLGRAVETCVAARRDCLRNPSPGGVLPKATGAASGRPQDDSNPVGRRAERKKAAHALVHELLAQGHSRRAIARQLGWGLNTVLRYTNAARWQDTLRENQPRPSRLDPTSPTWSDDSPRDAPASPDWPASWLPSKLPSPTAWSARTSPLCAGLHPGRRHGRRRCGR
ncbi:helix-turn-helix domain-containing protein [Streptomyces sasae]|uniref:helix-turn-helix domain-containing protein n=1 Tax=Streptomyces sasae TaxID=1266772 RepID=UPI00292E5797|nr:helix-turn-helix domain-containing protein [Streptomyces sasae]